MGYAIELYFDPDTETGIRQIRRTLSEQGITVTLDALRERPHVSLAVFPDADRDRLISIVQAFATKLVPFPIRLGATGVFPGNENVLFLVPVPTLQLLTVHRELHQQLAKANLAVSSYYSPDVWVPHCTVEMNIPHSQLTLAIELCQREFAPLPGSFAEIGVVEFRPVKSLAVWSLSGN